MSTLCIPCVLHAAAGDPAATQAQQDMARALLKLATIGVALVVLWLAN